MIKYCYLELPYLYLTATNNKEFTGKILLTLFCAESSEKNILGWCTIFHELKSAVKAKIAQNNLFAGFLRRNYSQTRKRFHSWIDYLKSESICPFCNLYLVSNCIQGLVNFWLQLFSIQWDGKYFNGWNCYLQHSSNSRKLSWLKFHNELIVCLSTAPCPSKNADWNQQQLTDGCILANWNSANYPYCFLIQSERSPDFGFLACDLWRIIFVSCPPPKNRLQRWRQMAWPQARENHPDAILKKIASGNPSIIVWPCRLACHLLQPCPIIFWQLLWCYGVPCLWGIR